MSRTGKSPTSADGPYFGDFHQNGGALKDPARPDRLDELAAIYNACAVAMKKSDPTIKTGGPAVARPDWLDFDTRFVAATLPHLDFFSYHAYASGSKDDPDAAIYDRAVSFGGTTRQIAAILRAASPQRHVLAVFDEYNVSWTWETRDPRMTNVKGAIFDALTMTAAVTNGADATAAWNDKDGVYGKMDNDLHLRPSANAFYLLNSSLRGAVVSADSDNAGAIVPYAVLNGTRHAVLLTNRSNRERTVSLQSSGWPLSAAKSWTLCRLTDAGYGETKMTAPPATVSVPAHSLLLLSAR